MPSGTGPFRLSEWLDNKQIALTANDYYYGAPPSFRRVEIALETSVTDALLKLQWGELDAVQNVLPSQVPIGTEYEELSFIYDSPKSFVCVMINPKWTNGEVTPFANRQERLALLQKIAAVTLNETVNDNTGTLDTGMTEYWYSLDTSLKILHDYSPEGDYESIIPLPTVPIICGPSNDELQTALAISDMLSQADIKTEIRQLSYAELVKEINDNDNYGLLVYKYNDRGNGLTDFFKLFIAPNINNYFLAEENSNDEDDKDNEDNEQDGENDLSEQLSAALNTAFYSDAENQKDTYLYAEQQLCDYGYLKILWYNNNNIVYNPQIRDLKEKLSALEY